MSIVAVDPTNAVAVTDYLTKARDWLATAVENTGPEQIARAKAEIATAAEATKQLGLSKEIQLDAQEMVRRAEFTLGKAIRKGQREGTIARRGDIGGPPPGAESRGRLQKDFSSAADFASKTELHGNATHGQPGLLQLADAGSEAFEQAIAEAKAEGNLSRKNVGRKVAKQAGPTTRDQRAELIADLAAQGYSSRQMVEKVGVRDDRVREIARAFDIDIPADRVVGRSRRIDHTDVVEKTVTDLENTAEFIQAHIDLSQVDFSEADEWVSSLSKSISALTRFRNQIKEKTHV